MALIVDDQLLACHAGEYQQLAIVKILQRKVPYTKKPLTFVKGFQAVRMGLEPTTSGVTGPHSNQLNYRTVFCCV